MRSRVMAEVAAASLILAGAAGGMVATASPAAAIGGGGGSCQSYQLDAYVTVNPPPNASIYVNDWDYCIPGPGGIAFPITISKYIGNNDWEVVATGNGDASYACGSVQYVYLTSISESQFYCG
jgi:hypothetical protein